MLQILYETGKCFERKTFVSSKKRRYGREVRLTATREFASPCSVAGARGVAIAIPHFPFQFLIFDFSCNAEVSLKFQRRFKDFFCPFKLLRDSLSIPLLFFLRVCWMDCNSIQFQMQLTPRNPSRDLKGSIQRDDLQGPARVGPCRGLRGSDHDPNHCDGSDEGKSPFGYYMRSGKVKWSNCKKFFKIIGVDFVLLGQFSFYRKFSFFSLEQSKG